METPQAQRQWPRLLLAKLFIVPTCLATRQLGDVPLRAANWAVHVSHAERAAFEAWEITGTAAMRDPENARALLRQLRTRGFTLAIDDFGTGCSSLAYLKLLAIDRIKIDRAFVQYLETNPNDAVIVPATIGMARSLGLGVVAAGVQAQGQA